MGLSDRDTSIGTRLSTGIIIISMETMETEGGTTGGSEAYIDVFWELGLKA